MKEKEKRLAGVDADVRWMWMCGGCRMVEELTQQVLGLIIFV